MSITWLVPANLAHDAGVGVGTTGGCQLEATDPHTDFNTVLTLQQQDKQCADTPTGLLLSPWQAV